MAALSNAALDAADCGLSNAKPLRQVDLTNLAAKLANLVTLRFGQRASVDALVMGPRNSVKVLRIHTPLIAASVMQLMRRSQRAVSLFIHKAMGHDHSALHPNATVSKLRYVPGPIPASRGSIDFIHLFNANAALVAKDVRDVFASHPSAARDRLFGNRRSIAASALAETGRIGCILGVHATDLLDRSVGAVPRGVSAPPGLLHASIIPQFRAKREISPCRYH